MNYFHQHENPSSPKSLSFHPTNQLKPSQFIGTRSILIIHDIKKVSFKV